MTRKEIIKIIYGILSERSAGYYHCGPLYEDDAEFDGYVHIGEMADAILEELTKQNRPQAV